MLYAKGSRIRLRYSAEEGVVTDILDKDLLMVRLDGDGMEIPIFVEDLENAREEYTRGVKSKGFPIAPAAGISEQSATPAAESQYAILKSFGIQLAFDPAPGNHFTIFLLNDTNQDYIFHFEWRAGVKVKMHKHGKISAVMSVELGIIHVDELNEQPEAVLKCARVTTEGPGPEMQKTIKIKAKKFFSKTTTAPILNRLVHLYKIFDKSEPEMPAGEKEDLKAYTLRKAIPSARSKGNLRAMPHEVEELAGFVPEIDLHIENLGENYKKLSSAEIIRIQLAHFDRYMEKAVRLGAERVFIIHGVGKGRLRDAIAGRLMQMEEVKTFYNNFHPRYGFGATEVILR